MDDDTPTTPLPTFHTQSSKKIAQTLAEGIAKLKCETVSTINNEKIVNFSHPLAFDTAFRPSLAFFHFFEILDAL